jgi:hypothetical protein
MVHTVDAVTFTQDGGLRFYGEQGLLVAIFTSFYWLKLVPTEEKPAEEDSSSTETPALSGDK